MRVSDKAIVLQQIRHGDRQSIVRLYTYHHGLVTVIASAGRSASSRIRASQLLPLTLLEVNFTLRENHELHRLSEASCYYVHDRLAGSLPKLSIAQFMNEVLLKTIREQTTNPALYDFIEGCLNYLNDSEKDFQNLHLYFLRELARHLGFEPHNNYHPTEAPFFDSREGAFSMVSLTFPLGLGKQESALLSRFLSANPLRESLPAADRAWLLDFLLAYFRLHVAGFNELRSLEVLRELGR